MKDDITVEETIKNVIEICLDRKKKELLRKDV